MMYHIGKALCFIIFTILFRTKVVGRENIPKDQPILLVSNHISNYDPPMLGAYLPRRLWFMAKSELFSFKPLGILLKSVGAFPVKRGMGDRQALKTGISLLNEGECMCLFPEGSRNRTGKLGKGLSGAGFFALRTDAVVIPSVIVGSYKPFKRMKVVYGPPIPMDDLREKKAKAPETTERIMEGIQRLLNEHYIEVKK